MCGIAGLLHRKASLDSEALHRQVRRMTSSLVHRGPDEGGLWADPDGGIGLGHRRLAILDLTKEGHQPMLSACGRYVIAFNGEVYNHADLRGELSAASGAFKRWRGHSDTEVMLAAVSHWGLRSAVSRFQGMFAFAVWDRLDRQLHLVRDRLGEKPLYYGWVSNVFVFASELKALREYSRWQGEIDRGVVALFLRHNYIPAPYSIYKGIFKLLPGSILTISADSVPEDPLLPSAYWSAIDVARKGVSNPFRGSEEEALQRLETLLTASVKQQMVSDVPLGAFLSGGIDSSAVVALMQSQSVRPVRTFTIGFSEKRYDESKHAAAIARHLGTDHTQFNVTWKDALDVIPRLPQIYDEPFSDSSQIPTFLVSQLARKHVTVSLSGDGGDELFAGYNRYLWGQNIWRNIAWMPPATRRTIAGILTTVPEGGWDRLFYLAKAILPTALQQKDPGSKIHKLAEMLEAKTDQEFYKNLVSHWKDPETVVNDAKEPLTQLSSMTTITGSHFTERMMLWDTISYLPDDILVKVDRASMAVSLESRVPFLDHRVVEFAWTIPLKMKLCDGQGKRLLRKLLYKHVPKALVDRPKMGFGVPIGPWMKGPLRGWCEDLLDPTQLKKDGYFDVPGVRQKWREYLAGHGNWEYHLWDILMFQSWLREFG